MEKNDDAGDFEYDEQEGEDAIPHDLDGWHWALSSDSENEGEPHVSDAKNKGASEVIVKGDEGKTPAADDVKTIHRVRVAETRPEYIECAKDGLVMKPAGATLGVHPGSCTWRGSYPGSCHYGRSWGPKRSPKKALLEVLKLILEQHLNHHKSDKIAKGQLARVTKAWDDA